MVAFFLTCAATLSLSLALAMTLAAAILGAFPAAHKPVTEEPAGSGALTLVESESNWFLEVLAAIGEAPHQIASALDTLASTPARKRALQPYRALVDGSPESWGELCFALLSESSALPPRLWMRRKMIEQMTKEILSKNLLTTQSGAL